jgi:acetoin utilization deacetylase AcuC-like enzyme
MIDTYYSSRYGADTLLNSMRKLPLIAAKADSEGLVNLIEPKGAEIVAKRLRKLHSPQYVAAFLRGEGKLAVSNGLNWSKEVRNGVLESVSGTLEAAKLAIEKDNPKVTASISSGFHHAEYGQGFGYCTFNALALVAQELPESKIFVLDCDEHQGQGTKTFTARLENLYNFSIFGTHFANFDKLPRSWDRMVRGWNQYEAALSEALVTILHIKPDLILYQAGMDCAEGDGMAKAKLSSDEIVERDRQVFEFCRDMGIPITFVMAGGYGEAAVDNHVGTFRTACGVFQPMSSSLPGQRGDRAIKVN